MYQISKDYQGVWWKFEKSIELEWENEFRYYCKTQRKKISESGQKLTIKKRRKQRKEMRSF